MWWKEKKKLRGWRKSEASHGEGEDGKWRERGEKEGVELESA